MGESDFRPVLYWYMKQTTFKVRACLVGLSANVLVYQMNTFLGTGAKIFKTKIDNQTVVASILKWAEYPLPTKNVRLFLLMKSSMDDVTKTRIKVRIVVCIVFVSSRSGYGW